MKMQRNKRGLGIALVVRETTVKMQRSRLRLVITLVVLVALGMIWWWSARRQPTPGRMEASQLVLTKAWDKQIVHVPGPLTIPPWLKQTREYKRVLRRGVCLDLTTTDLDGNRYVAHALGRTKNPAGDYVVCFSSIDKYREDGSLENVTLLADGETAFEWHIRDMKGNRSMFASKGNSGSYTVAFFENGEDKFVKEWEVDPELNIYSEQVRGEDGHYNFTHRTP